MSILWSVLKRLGNHLRYCKQRYGRDYTSYLAKSRAGPARPCSGICPKCSVSFQRLDSHLRLSATCQTICSPGPPPGPKSPVQSRDSNYTSLPNVDLTTSSGISVSDLAFKARIKLPKSTEEWEQADFLIQSTVVPLVQNAVSAEDKNKCLCNGVYDVLSSHFGTRPLVQSQRKAEVRFRQHDRALKRVTRLKNEARQTLRQAKRKGESGTVLSSLAAKFLSLLRTHSRLKRKSQKRYSQNEVKSVRQRCYLDFWKYAKELFEEDSSFNTRSSDF